MQTWLAELRWTFDCGADLNFFGRVKPATSLDRSAAYLLVASGLDAVTFLSTGYHFTDLSGRHRRRDDDR